MKLKIVIVGGGTAGWFCAACLAKSMPGLDISLVESPIIPKIGVGESTTPHVNMFLDHLGIDKKDFMMATGATQKYANKFVNWKVGNGESEFNAFTNPTDVNLLLRHIEFSTDWSIGYDYQDASTADAFMKLLTESKFDKFDKNFHSHYHYLINNKSPFNDNEEYLLNPLYSSTYHINAELAADYVRDKVAIPNGVKHIKSTIKHVVREGVDTKKIILEDNLEIEGDLFVDASGFHKILVNDWPVKEYKNHPVNSAWVCQLDYTDPEKQMLNYTESIAQDYGWLFKIGLYHRMGSGYCYNSNMLSDHKAREDYCNMVNNQKAEPRLIKWNPCRLENFAKGNTVAIGLSSGFVEPMEANSLYITVNGIFKLFKVLTTYIKTNSFDFKDYNESMSYAVDDIADFILIHYTLSSRENTEMWEMMREIGIKENHTDLVYEKYTSKKNTMTAAISGSTLFPNLVWGQWAHHVGLDLSKWSEKTFDPTVLEIAKLHFSYIEQKHRTISKTRKNNFIWHRDNIFNGLTPLEWQACKL